MFLRLTSTASIPSDLRQAQISQEATPPARGSLLASSLYHVQTCAYCSLSPAWELAEDPLPRLALLFIRQQALLVYRIPWDIDPRARTEQLVLARTPVTVTVDSSLPRDVKAPVSTALPSWGRVRVAST